ncbi:MAG TPA: AAA family ATPase, partial [Gaiellaceae bacterium]|nr:AAA family ATPase [Gaiellaceae bacterium]
MSELDRLSETCGRVLDEVERAVLGKREALELLLLGVLADGNVLIEDFPGLAKTLAARSLARATSLEFARIQFTPDLMPSDVTGSSIYNQRESDFEFRAGPIFTNILLADEINRTSPKTQAALLQAMQEYKVSVGGADNVLA